MFSFSHTIGCLVINISIWKIIFFYYICHITGVFILTNRTFQKHVSLFTWSRYASEHILNSERSILKNLKCKRSKRKSNMMIVTVTWIIVCLIMLHVWWWGFYVFVCECIWEYKIKSSVHTEKDHPYLADWLGHHHNVHCFGDFMIFLYY
jgi:hypothetical protein